MRWSLKWTMAYVALFLSPLVGACAARADRGEVISAADVYWITRCDSLQVVLVVAAVILLVAGVVLIEHRWGRTSLIVGVAFLIGRAFVPSTRDLCAVIVVPKIANAQGTADVAGEVVDLARDWLKELKPEKNAAVVDEIKPVGVDREQLRALLRELKEEQ